jgi:hypothetical protein
MADQKESPAVLSMKNEQAEQRRRFQKGELDKGLEATFPASDPISVTHSAVPAGRTDASEAERVRDNEDEYPVADETVGDPERNAAELWITTSEVASGAAQDARAQARSFLTDIEGKGP